MRRPADPFLIPPWSTTTSTVPNTSPANAPAASAVTAAPSAQGSLPRPVIWTALIIAAALPVILLITAVVVMLSLNYNFLNWME